MADTVTQLEANKAQTGLLSELIPNSHITIRYTEIGEGWEGEGSRIPGFQEGGSLEKIKNLDQYFSNTNRKHAEPMRAVWVSCLGSGPVLLSLCQASGCYHWLLDWAIPWGVRRQDLSVLLRVMSTQKIITCNRTFLKHVDCRGNLFNFFSVLSLWSLPVANLLSFLDNTTTQWCVIWEWKK